jgi:ectoine hydroxylase-related dioxygenase (phytanoyl-CoA dioxygenase family)
MIASLDGVLAHFDEHGYARLGKVMSDETLALLRERADAIMLGRVSIEGLFYQLDTETGAYDDLVFGRGYEGPSLNYRKIEKLERDDRFRACIDHPLFEKIARALIAGPIVIYRAVLMNKGSGGGTVLPWHQDGGLFWGLDRDPILQIWTALDDAPIDAGCVEVVPGSHKAGLATPLGGVIPDDHVRRREAEANRLLLPAEAGEAILLHNHLWHRSLVNRTGKARRAFSVCYMSADTKCTRKKRAPREFVRVFD